MSSFTKAETFGAEPLYVDPQTSLPVCVEVRRHTARRPWTYAQLDQHQREIARRLREQGGQGVLLLSELAPVITRGRRTPTQDLLLPAEQLRRQGIELWETDRGGLATYHGPGQWVLFPVDHLETLVGDTRGVRKAVETLLEIAFSVGRATLPPELKETVEIRDGKEMGVWTSCGKFAAVGVHIEQRVLLHGLAINGYRTPTSFQGLRPCGLDRPVDFLLRDEFGGAQRERDFEELGIRLVQETFRRFWKSSAFFRSAVDLNLS